MINPTTPAADAAPKRKTPPGVLLFVPGALNRGAFITWLKRIHAWTGLWGALAFLLIGASGFTLNHRATLKIDTGDAREVSSVVLPIDPAAIKSADDLGKWAQAKFGTSIEPRTPRGGPGNGESGRGGQRGDRVPAGGDAPPHERNMPRTDNAVAVAPAGAAPASATPATAAPATAAPASAAPASAGEAEFMGKRVRPAEVWKQAFSGPHAVLTVEYTPGANTVKATKTEQNFFGTLKNLHKGVGLSMWWVLFIDTMAGGLIAMSLTGALLWSRLHGPRLAAIGIALASFALALTAAWPSLS